MNRGDARPLLAHGMIVAALAVGGWLMVVDPMARELRRIEGVIADARNGSVEPAGAAVEDMAAQLVSIRSRVRDIATRSEAGRDSARLYRTIMDEAQRQGVTVRSLSPVMAAAATQAPGTQPGPNASCAAARVELSAEGRYESVAALLQALQNSEAHVRLVTLSLTPTSSECSGVVAAKVVFETLSFRVPEALAGLNGGGNAPR